MKHYRIDELRYQDYEKIKQHLDDTCGPCQVEGVYWVALGNDQLGEVQSAHKDCQPFYFAIELTANAISFELLVRTRKRMRCDCIQYADADQREHIIRFADHLFEHLKLMS
jgi:hypothetical protein